MRLLTPAALRSAVCHDEKVALAGLSGLRAHPRLLLLASHIAGIAPLFGFTAITLGLVGYVTPIFKRSALFPILWAKLFLGEGQIRERLLGATVMMVGGRHGGCLRTPTLMKNRKDRTRQIFSPCASFHLMKEYSSLWYFRHLRIEVEYGSFQKEVWRCICSNTCVKMQYVAAFRKGVWQECPNRKECVAVICWYTLSFQMAYQAHSCICIR